MEPCGWTQEQDKFMLELKITICIPNYNSIKTIQKVLDSVKGYPTLIYDNGSTDGSEKFASKVIPRLNVRDKYWNISRVRKELVKDCQTEYMMCLDSDTPCPVPIEELYAEFEEGVGAVGCKIGNANHQTLQCLLIKTEYAKKLNWNLVFNKCECRNVTDQLKKLKLIIITI